MAEIAKREQLSRRGLALKTAPRVYYRGLERILKAFVGGNVVARDQNGQLDNVAGADVAVSISGAAAVRAVTDAFGDFRADGLVAENQTFHVRVTHRLGTAEYSGELPSSINIGTVELRNS
jgi:argonaute-like protein implicated in RNA metabolism and viral defense